ncbi:MAG: hypothetical protein IKA72_01150 [Clostridia bacterium]|nr:hypothetical protein [Clostridia bacterium]
MAFFQKPIFVKRKKGEAFFYEKRGVCLGVYISKKSAQIKHLFCSLDDDKNVNLPFSAVERIDEFGGIYLKNLRSAFPNQCARLTPYLPVYSCEGRYMGRLDGIICENSTVSKLIVSGKKYPALAIDGVCDVVLLKPLPYPLGEWSEEKQSGVSRRILKEKIKQGELIKFTLSLAPFSIDYDNAG